MILFRGDEVHFIWRSTSYDRMQVGLRVFILFGRTTEYSTILMLLLNDYYADAAEAICD